MESSVRALSPFGRLRAPVFLAGFAGRNGGSAAAALQYLADEWDAVPLAEIDPEELFDFTVRRPIVRTVDGERVIEWPVNRIYLARPDGLERDLLLLPGIEPHMRWRGFCDGIAAWLESVDCREAVLLGSRSGAVPHTRPTPLRLVSDDARFSRRFGLPAQAASYEGPIGLSTVLRDRLEAAGIAVAALTAMTPFYVAAEPNPRAMLGIINAVDAAYGTSTSLVRLEHAGAELDAQADAALAGSPELRTAVRSMEQQYDWIRGAQPSKRPEGEVSSEDLPSGQEVVAELEQFLRDHRGGFGRAR